MFGIFEGDEYTTRLTQCKVGAQRESFFDSAEELPPPVSDDGDYLKIPVNLLRV